QQLLEMQADREHVSVEQLLQREVTGRVKDPTQDQLEVFYEGLKTTEPFDAVRDKILGTIRQIRLGTARNAYLQSLRSEANIRIALTPPNADVAADNAQQRGTANAPVRIVEFADYECPYCQAVHPEVKKLQEEFG